MTNNSLFMEVYNFFYNLEDTKQWFHLGILGIKRLKPLVLEDMGSQVI